MDWGLAIKHNRYQLLVRYTRCPGGRGEELAPSWGGMPSAVAC
jgi:hypothetical protein